MTLSILQVNASDSGGGAETVGLELHRAYRDRGLEATLAVGLKRTSEPGVVAIGEHRTLRERALRDPRVAYDVLRGREDFRHPASHRVLELAAHPPDVLHLHNLHGGYFDLGALPMLAARRPTVVTMHDEWLYTGHCGYSIDGERWLTGCGSCPHLDTFPALKVDGTASNWKRKAAIYTQAKLHVVAPSAWLLQRAERSMLAPAIASARVIPNGIDLELFAPGPPGRNVEPVVVFAAQGARTNPYKDFETLRAALELLRDRPLLAIAFGEAGDEERIGRVTLRSEAFGNRGRVAETLRRADVYVHATKADNHPLAVLEALACGVPVVAPHVAGIPEQLTEDTGVLVGLGDAPGLARAIGDLLADDGRRARMGEAAAADARARFGLERQVDAYLDLYVSVAG